MVGSSFEYEGSTCATDSTGEKWWKGMINGSDEGTLNSRQSSTDYGADFLRSASVLESRARARRAIAISKEND